MDFKFVNSKTGEEKTVTISEKEIRERMHDDAFERLSECDCPAQDCDCYELYEDFELVNEE